MKNFTLILCLILTILHIIGMPESFALSHENGSISHLTYMLVHGGWVHLLINIYALLSLAFLCDMKWWHFIVSLIVAISMPIIGDLPLIGISTLIYAVTGIILMNSNRWWWLGIINLLIIGSSMFMPGVAFVAHLYCFLWGMFIGYITNKRYGRKTA